jgi:hypothetical protein
MRRSITSTERAGRAAGPAEDVLGCTDVTTVAASPEAAAALVALEGKAASAGPQNAVDEANAASWFLSGRAATRFRVQAVDAADAAEYGPTFFEEPPWTAVCVMRWIQREKETGREPLRSPQGRVVLGVEFDVASGCSLFGRDHTRRELVRALRGYRSFEDLQAMHKSALCTLYTEQVAALLHSGVSGLQECAAGGLPSAPTALAGLRRKAALLLIDDTPDAGLCGRVAAEIRRLRPMRTLWSRIVSGPDVTRKQLLIGVGAVAALATAFVFRREIAGAASSAYQSVSGALDVLNGTDESAPPQFPRRVLRGTSQAYRGRAQGCGVSGRPDAV